MNRLGSMVQGLLERMGVSVLATWRLERRAAALHLRQLFESYGVDAVFDVGANEGQFCDFLRREVGYAGWIFSYEPAPTPLAVLHRRAAADSKWRVIDKALGAKAGTQELNIAQHSTLSSFRPPRFDETEHAFASRTTITSVPVPVTTLDEAYEEVSTRFRIARPFLKLDTQGYDLEVVRGGRTAISSVVALQTELSIIPLYEGMPSYLETIAALKEDGFHLSSFFPVALESDLRLIEVDCTMVRPESRLVTTDSGPDRPLKP